MAKILKNTTNEIIELKVLGLTLPANGQIILEVTDYLKLSSVESLSELTTLITDGDIVVNNGTDDLQHLEAINYIAYPDFAQAVKFLSEPERNNNLYSKDVQTAIEEVLFVAETDNFSYRIINKNLNIKYEQQMVVFQEFCVEENVELIIDGEVVII
jgi:hypothetical protein